MFVKELINIVLYGTVDSSSPLPLPLLPAVARVLYLFLPSFSSLYVLYTYCAVLY